MSVTDQLHVDPDQLLQWAVAHEQSAEDCVAARAEHPAKIAQFESWGPIAHESRKAGIEAVNARETFLLDQERKHRAMAAQLRASAAQFGAMNDANAAALAIRTD